MGCVMGWDVSLSQFRLPSHTGVCRTLKILSGDSSRRHSNGMYIYYWGHHGLEAATATIINHGNLKRDGALKEGGNILIGAWAQNWWKRDKTGRRRKILFFEPVEPCNWKRANSSAWGGGGQEKIPDSQLGWRVLQMVRRSPGKTERPSNAGLSSPPDTWHLTSSILGPVLVMKGPKKKPKF